MIPRWSTNWDSTTSLSHPFPLTSPWNDPVLQCGLGCRMIGLLPGHIQAIQELPLLGHGLDMSKKYEIYWNLMTTQEESITLSSNFRAGNQLLNCACTSFRNLKHHKNGIIMFPHFLLAIRCVFAHHFLQHHQVTIFHASAHAELVGFLLWDILKWRVDEASINGFHSSVGFDILLENLQENHEYL